MGEDAEIGHSAQVTQLKDALRHAEELLRQAQDFVQKAVHEGAAADPRAIPRPGQGTIKSRRPHRYVTLYMPQDLLDALDAIAESHGVTRAADIRMALQRHVEANGRSG